MAGILEEDNPAAIADDLITPFNLKIIGWLHLQNMKATRINWIILEILVLVVGSGLILWAALGMIAQMDEDMIALEVTAELAGSSPQQR